MHFLCLQSTTIREFDDRFTAPMFGYATWQDYYRDACLHDKIHGLKVPVLCLSAADDPFSPYHGINIIVFLLNMGPAHCDLEK